MIYQGSCPNVLRGLAAESAQCCVTSPPYWGLRDYGIPPSIWGGDPTHRHVWAAAIRPPEASGFHRRQQQTVTGGIKDFRSRAKSLGAFCQCGAWRGCLGLEPSPELYVAHLVETFRAVRRVLKSDATLWLNLGDCYATGAGKANIPGGGYRGAHEHDAKRPRWAGPYCQPNRMPLEGLKPKDLVGIPWRVAFALQADGWYLRSDIIWHKPNPMPESIEDRPTKAHEYLFLLAKSERYYYDHEAVKEPAVSYHGSGMLLNIKAKRDAGAAHDQEFGPTRNRRSVWTLSKHPFKGAHFATFPPALVEPCILAGSRIGDTVLDPFAGSGTTGIVAQQHGRNFLGIELSPAYVRMARRRISREQITKTAASTG